MKVKRDTPNDPPTPPAAAGDPPAPAPTPGPKTKVLVPPRAPRDSKRQTKVLLTALDGKIEWDKMDKDARKQLEELFKNPEFLKTFGIAPRRSFDPKQCKALYDAMGMVYKTVCGLFLRWPDAALAVVGYSPEQKEMLAEPTANLLDRLAPKLLQQNSELVMWLMIFAGVTQSNFLKAAAIAKDVQARKLPARAPASMTRPETGPVVVPRKTQPPAPAPDELAELPAPDVTIGPGEIPSGDSLDDFSGTAGEHAAQEFARSLG